MKLRDTEIVDGTRVKIGRRVQTRKVSTGTVERVSKSFSAEYRDADGKRRFEGLGTTVRREARRRAIEIQSRIDQGKTRRPSGRLTIDTLIRRYTAFNTAKGLAPKTLAKYAADLDKLRAFCDEEGIELAGRFDEEAFYRFQAWLRTQSHKQRAGYASKSIYTALTITKQAFKYAHRQRLIQEDRLAAARLPTGKARPQPCFREEQIRAMLARCRGMPEGAGWDTTHAAIAILAYTGLRVGELGQLTWVDVRLDLGELGMLHVRRGGSGETTKDKEERFIPVHPVIRPVLDGLPREGALVLPGLRTRTLLARIKRLCRDLGYGADYKTHSLRHFFASHCANSGIPYRMALSWLGHSSSDILDLYYYLHDEEAESAMKTLAAGGWRAR